MKTLFTLLSTCAISFALISCGSKTGTKVEEESPVKEVQAEVEEPATNYLTDIDGNKYKIITIGEQTWMAENLNVKHYRNGDEIPQVIDGTAWEDLEDSEQGAWCYPENNSENEKKFGKLYNWFAAMDSRGLAPEGWRIPSDEDWTKLAMFLGGSEVAGAKMKERKGFNGKYTGYRSIGDFDYPGIGIWWSTLRDNYTVWCRYIYDEGPELVRDNEDSYLTDGISVRCIKND